MTLTDYRGTGPSTTWRRSPGSPVCYLSTTASISDPKMPVRLHVNWEKMPWQMAKRLKSSPSPLQLLGRTTRQKGKNEQAALQNRGVSTSESSLPAPASLIPLLARSPSWAARPGQGRQRYPAWPHTRQCLHVSPAA